MKRKELMYHDHIPQQANVDRPRKARAEHVANSQNAYYADDYHAKKAQQIPSNEHSKQNDK